MHIKNIASGIKKMTFNELRNVILENYYKRIWFLKERSYYTIKCLKRKDLLLLSAKLIEKISYPHNAKEHYQSFLRKKKIKWVTQSKLITQQPKPFEIPIIVDIKSVIIEPPKTLLKLCY